MRISDWSSDVCSSDLQVLALDLLVGQRLPIANGLVGHQWLPSPLGVSISSTSTPPLSLGWTKMTGVPFAPMRGSPSTFAPFASIRSEEHTSELQSLMRISYAVLCLNKTHILLYI